MEPVRLGMIGCGVIGPSHIQGAKESPLIQVAAVADLIEEQARIAAEKFGVERIYREGDDLIEDQEVEAVVLAMACLPLNRAGPARFCQEKYGTSYH